MDIDIERLKMDAAYWDSVAPDGANYYLETSGIFVADTLMPSRPRIIPRPTKPSAPEWDGEGLPPVGCEVEYYSESEALSPDECNLDEHCVVDTWKPGDSLKVIAYAKMPFGQDFIDIPVVQNAQTHQVSSLMQKYIRPIRTKEQRQRDELAVEIWSLDGRSKDHAYSLADHILSRYNLEPKDA